MSRSGMARKADKGKSHAIPSPSVSQDIIPGKFTEKDWNLMLAKDDGEEFISDIVLEVVEASLKTIYERYIQSKRIPFTVWKATSDLLQVVELQFFAYDEGDPVCSSDPLWVPDDEPKTCLTDCWALGSVSHEKRQEPELTANESLFDTAVDNDSAAEAPDNEGRILDDKEPGVEKIVSSSAVDQTEEDECSEGIPVIVPQPPPVSLPKRRIKWKPKKGRIDYSSIADVGETLSQADLRILKGIRGNASIAGSLSMKSRHGFPEIPSFVEALIKKSNSTQKGRPPGPKDIQLDSEGNIVSILKISPDNLPDQKIKTAVSVLDTVKVYRKGEGENGKHPKNRSKNSIHSPPVSVFRGEICLQGSHYEATLSKESGGISAPPMFDTIKLSPGVTFRDGNHLRRGPSESRIMNQSQFPQSLGALRKLQLPVRDVFVCDILPDEVPRAFSRGRFELEPLSKDRSFSNSESLLAHSRKNILST